MRGGTRVRVFVAAGALLVAGGAGAALRAGRADRVWAYVPSPVWREDPPAHAAMTQGGPALPSSEWETAVATSGGGPSTVLVRHRPSAFFLGLSRLLGLGAKGDYYVAVDAGRRTADGVWHECALLGADGSAQVPGAIGWSR